MTWEFKFLDFIHYNLMSDIQTKIFAFFSYASTGGIIWILICLILLINKKTRKVGIVMAAAMVFDLIIVHVLVKPFFHRIRPYDVNTAIQVLIRKPHDFSFPSGHTAISFTCVGSLFLCKKYKLFLITFIIALLTAYSRLYFYIHYPTDIIAGILFGLLCAFLGFMVANRIKYTKNI